MARDGIEPPTQGFSGFRRNQERTRFLLFGWTVLGAVADTEGRLSTAARALSLDVWLKRRLTIVFEWPRIFPTVTISTPSGSSTSRSSRSDSRPRRVILIRPLGKNGFSPNLSRTPKRRQAILDAVSDTITDFGSV
jgi:hypothetical protein